MEQSRGTGGENQLSPVPFSRQQGCGGAGAAGWGPGETAPGLGHTSAGYLALDHSLCCQYKCAAFVTRRESTRVVSCRLLAHLQFALLTQVDGLLQNLHDNSIVFWLNEALQQDFNSLLKHSGGPPPVKRLAAI